jgi:hypothetical protein
LGRGSRARIIVTVVVSEVGRTIETSDSQGNGKVSRPVLQPAR